MRVQSWELRHGRWEALMVRRETVVSPSHTHCVIEHAGRIAEFAEILLAHFARCEIKCFLTFQLHFSF